MVIEIAYFACIDIKFNILHIYFDVTITMQEHYIYCHLTYTQAACPPSVTLIYYKVSNTISGAVLQPHGCRKTPTKGHWTLRDLLVNIRSYADESASDGKWNVYEVRCRKK